MTQARAAEALHEDLTHLRDAVKSAAVLTGFLAFSAGAAALVFAFTLFAGMDILPLLRSQAARWAALVLLTGGGTAAFALLVVRPLLWNPTFERLARLAEERIDGLDNAYINAVQLSRVPRCESPLLLFRALDECRARARRFQILTAVDRRPLRRAGVAAATAAALLLVYAVGARDHFLSGFDMLVNPSRFIPSVGAARIAYVKPGDAQFVRGQEIEIEAALEKPLDTLVPGRVRLTFAGGEKVEKDLLAVSPTEFRAALGPAQLPFEYLVEIAGTQTRWYGIGVVERPAVRSITLRYLYPEYTGKGHEVMTDSTGDVAGPYGTVVEMLVEATRPLASGYLQFEGSRIDLLSGDAETRVTARFVLQKTGLYRMSLTDTAGNMSDASVTHSITVSADQPPAVALPVPGRDVAVPPSAKVMFALDVSDDYGIASADLVMVDGRSGAESTVSTWSDLGVKAATLPFSLVLDAERFKAGTSWAFYARAKDANSLTGPGEGRSQAIVVRVVDDEASRAEDLANLASWQERLRKLLEREEGARAAVGTALVAAGVAGEVVTRVRDEQLAILGDTARLAADMADGPAGVADVRRVLEGLVAGDMAAAAAACDAALKAPAVTPLDVAGIQTVQDHIIDTLRRLLTVIEALAEQARSGKLAAGNEIPSDAQEMLRKLLEELKRFVEDQKRIVEATSNLAAVPVDDYTDEHLRKIDELKAAETDWSKFLQEAYSDLSKLPKQDFTNPSILSDIVETYSEIEMAADALAKQALTIAVPREQTGLELAEALTTHLEKWLPDQPDRIKWDMEEPLAALDVPMAELPTELQDIIGDLMEQEEDLISDIEDVSSSWADSLDKGAGWDALDGPISNMSAQGVTGNVLPNSSEIGGRSGEGRTGKSSGEFVGDSAVGKGGRRTPTRITPDPFMAGDIRDTSPEAATGATGGGKVSGAGAEGLQGPVPRELSRQVAALAGRQAEIISRSQKVNLTLQLAGYPNADMEAALGTMREAEQSLRDGNLGSAIRRRAVLVKSLKNVGAVVGNELVINRDNALVLPKEMREEIIDGAQGRAPRGYSELLRGYYESLSTSQ